MEPRGRQAWQRWHDVALCGTVVGMAGPQTRGGTHLTRIGTTLMAITAAEASSTVSERLVGATLAAFAAEADAYTLSFASATRSSYLTAQEIRTPRADEYTRALRAIDASLVSGVDAERVPACLVLAACLRAEVISVDVDVSGELTLALGRQLLVVPTDVSIVDWQWTLGDEAGSPYQTSFAVACFWKDQLQSGV